MTIGISRAIIAACALGLPGCAQYTAGLTAGVDQYARVQDEAQHAAELLICRGISIGAWRRAYGEDPERAEAWRVLCADRPTATPAGAAGAAAGAEIADPPAP
jgi:hypothetical protein